MSSYFVSCASFHSEKLSIAITQIDMIFTNFIIRKCITLTSFYRAIFHNLDFIKTCTLKLGGGKSSISEKVRGIFTLFGESFIKIHTLKNGIFHSLKEREMFQYIVYREIFHSIDKSEILSLYNVKNFCSTLNQYT